MYRGNEHFIKDILCQSSQNPRKIETNKKIDNTE